MARYFFSQRSNRPLAVNGRTYRFDQVSFTAGNYCGVVLAESPEAVEDMVRAVELRLGVVEIPEDEYSTLKKKQPAIPSLDHSSVSNGKPRPIETQRPQNSLSMTSRPGVVSAESATPQTESASPAKAVLDPSDVIKIDRVAPPQPFVEEKDRIGNAVEKTPRKRKAKQ